MVLVCRLWVSVFRWRGRITGPVRGWLVGEGDCVATKVAGEMGLGYTLRAIGRLNERVNI